MINTFKNKSINQVTKITILSTAIITIFITVAFFSNAYKEHIKELQKIENDYLVSQKSLIQKDTKRAIRYITYKHNKNKNIKNIQEIKKQIVETIENMRDIRDGSGYIFIYTFDGINIADPILKHNAGKNLIDFKDPNGKLVIKELIDISKEQEGGFVEYVWNKPISNVLTKKISYAQSYGPFNWMVGSGIYLDDIQNVLQEKKQEYKEKISQYVIQIFLFVTALFLTSIAVSKYFTFLIQKDINSIRLTLKNVSIEYSNINLKKIQFREFKQISQNINLMIDELRDLNRNLENKVENRTQELKKSEQFALELVESQDKFIKNAIHEINTPLSIIIANIDLFKLKYGENRYLSKIEAGSKIVHNIYNDLAYLVKKDRIKYEKISINFSEFLQERIEFFDEIAIGNDLSISMNIQEELFINFNDTQLQRICDNTLSNAIKYSFAQSVIYVKLDKIENEIVLDIQNTGETLSNPEKLFQRYYRENEARGGFGLGLSIVEEICKQTDTKILVISENNTTNFIYKFTIGY